MKLLKKRNKKYINRAYLKALIELAHDHPLQTILHKVDPQGTLQLLLIRRVLRRLIFYFLRNVCVCAILSSSKLDPNTKHEHLQRRGEVEAYLTFHIKNSPSSQ